MPASPRSLTVFVLRGLLCGLVYVVVIVANSVLFSLLHVNVPNPAPSGTSQAQAFVMLLIASALLGVALMPLAVGLSGSRLLRSLALAMLLLVCLGVNATIEILVFTSFVTRQTALPFLASNVFPSVALATSLAFPKTQGSGSPTFVEFVHKFFGSHSAVSWMWRICLAIIAFPLIYLVFGAMVAPLVVPAYRAGITGLVLPPLSVIMPVQILRSSLFLIGSLPCLILWRGRRGSLVFALGLAHWFLVGLFGLLQSSFLPSVLRVAHSLEIGADSFVYAAVLVFLLCPRLQPIPVFVHSRDPVFPS